MSRRAKNAGFTLVEVLVAILIIGVVSLVLLYRRIDVVKDAGRIRDERIAWSLAGLKLGELSSDPTLVKDSDAGDFSESAADQASFRWSYETEREVIPFDETPGKNPRYVRRIRLKIFDPEENLLQQVEAMYPDAPPLPPESE